MMTLANINNLKKIQNNITIRESIIKISLCLFFACMAYIIASLINQFFYTIIKDSYNYLTAPLIEEILKFSLGRLGSLFFAIIEFIEYTNIYKNVYNGSTFYWFIIIRITLTIVMHVNSYKMGKRKGLLVAILYHAIFNYMVYLPNIEYITLYLYVYVPLIWMMIKK